MPRLSFPRSSFYWKLATSHAAIALLAALFIGLLLRHQLTRDLRVELEQTLQNTCLLLAPYARADLSAPDVLRFEEEFQRLGRETGIRLTWIRHDGTVIGETHAESRLLENHADRREVKQAYLEDFGREERKSTSIGREMSYVARAIEVDGEPVGVIRAALPLDTVHERVDQMSRVVVWGTLLGALAAVLGGLYAARRIARPIAAMTRTAEALGRGDHAARARDLPGDEIGALGRALNELAAALTRRLAASSAEQARLRAVLAGMIEGVVAVDGEDRVLFSNRAARELLVGDADRALEGRLWEHVRVPGLGELLREAQESSGLARRELSVIGEEGETLLDAHAAPFRGGGARGVVIVLHDVSELRRLERIRRDFVANVSHELKTPLTAIHGYVETLLSGALHDEQNNERFLRKIDHHVQRLVHLVTDLLSLARIEAQEGEATLVSVDLRGVVAEVVREHEPESKVRKQELVYARAPEPVVVEGDRDGLIQVVGNLLDNAIKYTPVGGRIEVQVGRSGDVGWAEVRDSGIGIPPGEVERIFERFYRVDKARSREMGGTGLGLSIVKHLVSVMRGTVHVESTPGKGSKFRVQLACPPASVQ